MSNGHATAHDFFDRYAAARLARDEKTIGAMYAVPALILFPGQSILVTDSRPPEDFFTQSWTQYEGVQEADKQLVLLAEVPGSLWVDVTWSYDGRVQERFCYQLVEQPEGHRIAVLTPSA